MAVRGERMARGKSKEEIERDKRSKDQKIRGELSDKKWNDTLGGLGLLVV